MDDSADNMNVEDDNDPADDDHEEDPNNDDDEEEDEELQADDDDNEEEEEELFEEDYSDEQGTRRSGRTRRQPERLGNSNGKSKRGGRRRTNYAESDEGGNSDDDDDEAAVAAGRRRSSRANKNKRSMKEPTDSVQDLLQGTSTTIPARSNNNNKKSTPKKKAPPPPPTAAVAAALHGTHDEEEEENLDTQPAPESPTSPPKTRGRHSKNRRKSISVLEDVDSGEDKKDEDEDYMDVDDEYDDELEEEEEEEDETMKIQRILASRSETRKKWREICGKMNSSEVTDGSRWFQGNMSAADNSEDDEVIEERFLVKWSGLSYLHVTWETQQDLLDQVENAKAYISTFFRKSTNGILFSQDERKDGDYFDPGYVEIDRILEVSPPDGYRGKLPTTWEEELAVDPVKEYGVVLDKTNTKAFDLGVGRQFLIKYTSLNYSEASYEFERDLMLLDVDFRDKLKEFYERTRKPTKAESKAREKNAEEASRRAYVLFGEKTSISAEEKEKKVAEYQQQLQEHVYENGGQLRDYQAEGVTWFLSNFVNERSCIMADEMGLVRSFDISCRQYCVCLSRSNSVLYCLHEIGENVADSCLHPFVGDQNASSRAVSHLCAPVHDSALAARVCRLDWIEHNCLSRVGTGPRENSQT
jgi:Chromo (CHRromatin Organisation MOdifier) domain